MNSNIFSYSSRHDAAKEGYYKFSDSKAIYYHIGTDWYSSSSGGDDWHEVGSMTSRDDVEEAYLSSVFSSGWGVSNFKNSDAYEEYEDRHSSSSSDYDDWDMGDTDWDSDW